MIEASPYAADGDVKEIKEAVQKTLESQGFLNHIRVSRLASSLIPDFPDPQSAVWHHPGPTARGGARGLGPLGARPQAPAPEPQGPAARTDEGW
jgi:hypothetical protein